MGSNTKYLGIILAAGKGNRLDFNGPKPLFNVFGLPMIDYIINSFFKDLNDRFINSCRASEREGD